MSGFVLTLARTVSRQWLRGIDIEVDSSCPASARFGPDSRSFLSDMALWKASGADAAYMLAQYCVRLDWQTFN